jgi:hypothetical protein
MVLSLTHIPSVIGLCVRVGAGPVEAFVPGIGVIAGARNERDERKIKLSANRTNRARRPIKTLREE